MPIARVLNARSDGMAQVELEFLETYGGQRETCNIHKKVLVSMAQTR
jgi:hypothetical protein